MPDSRRVDYNCNEGYYLLQARAVYQWDTDVGFDDGRPIKRVSGTRIVPSLSRFLAKGGTCTGVGFPLATRSAGRESVDDRRLTNMNDHCQSRSRCACPVDVAHARSLPLRLLVTGGWGFESARQLHSQTVADEVKC